MSAKGWTGAAAVLGWCGLTVQLYLILIARWQGDASLLGGLVNFFGFFTVLSNILVATVLTADAFGRDASARRFWLAPSVVSGVLASILFVAIAYSLLLRHLWQPRGWQWIADGLLHDVMPLLFALYWWRRTHKGALRIGHVLAWSGYPLVYFGYVLLRGQMIGFYPYPFIDVAALGYEQVLLNALVMLAAFMLLGLCVVGLDRWQGKCRGQA
ncbi:Pr6Pr family membrane protein [Pseudomonas sp. GD04058]|uniref:Pr6Pr family membrane protein n=1 Tax=Pseudomonas sp. GD04058 TaxID=2975429 RepID=UPI00244C377A|nr:Pr6Pr family membrane protein [Pseudomonas sp. GD04058]MDG9884986.1 Pr6Pr family membrane protein [Pseudomonas sp. GD04058]